MGGSSGDRDAGMECVWETKDRDKSPTTTGHEQQPRGAGGSWKGRGQSPHLGCRMILQAGAHLPVLGCWRRWWQSPCQTRWHPPCPGSWQPVSPSPCAGGWCLQQRPACNSLLGLPPQRPTCRTLQSSCLVGPCSCLAPLVRAHAPPSVRALQVDMPHSASVSSTRGVQYSSAAAKPR